MRDLSDIFIHFLTINKKVINKQIINLGFDQNNFQINDIVKLIKRQHATAEVTYTGIHPDSRSYKVSFRKFSKMLPSLKQNWDLEKSISDLYKNLKKYKITDSDFHSQKFERIKALSRLLSQKKLNEKLFWQRPFTLKK